MYDAIEYPVSKLFFWTDSMSTIRYISNTTSRFKVFVANRLSIILEVTDAKDWHYVSTKESPADLASRGISPDDRTSLFRWLNGPTFLQGKHRLTELLIRDCHENNGQVGAQQVISLLREKYWITQATTVSHVDEEIECRVHEKWRHCQLKD